MDRCGQALGELWILGERLRRERGVGDRSESEALVVVLEEVVEERAERARYLALAPHRDAFLELGAHARWELVRVLPAELRLRLRLLDATDDARDDAERHHAEGEEGADGRHDHPLRVMPVDAVCSNAANVGKRGDRVGYRDLRTLASRDVEPDDIRSATVKVEPVLGAPAAAKGMSEDREAPDERADLEVAKEASEELDADHEVELRGDAVGRDPVAVEKRHAHRRKG
mmetsp:Transcript_73233/g.201079  ORF Transcript_73233/g.201079 Transcript_73233/m.201079 type:complete len:229 (-) Transcript_73233:595-1281(-)